MLSCWVIYHLFSGWVTRLYQGSVCGWDPGWVTEGGWQEVWGEGRVQ